MDRDKHRNVSKSDYQAQMQWHHSRDVTKLRAELARLLPLWPSDISDTTPQGRARIIGQLVRALKAERRRGLAGHWSYDIARHTQLYAALQEERKALAHIKDHDV